MKVLHLEDSPSDAELIGLLLRREWPDCAIRHVSTPKAYQAALSGSQFDIILSDYTLPGFTGLSALATAQATAPGTPFVFLSGTIGEERAVEALKNGATDYIIKDRPTRLVPAIRQAFALIAEAERRRRSEAQLRENEERFRKIAENVAEFIALLDLDGRRLYVNPAHDATFGPGATLLGTDAFREILPEDRPRVRAAFEQTACTGLGISAEFQMTALDGSVHQIEAQGSAVRDADNRVVNILLVSRDVTARRESAARLRDQASLLDKARDAIVATGTDRRITYWNASAERLYGWTFSEVVGRRLDEIDLGFDATRFSAAHEQVMSSGEWRGDFRLRTKSGGTLLVESTWSLVVESDGRPRSILYIDTDVTERKKLETQLLRSQRMESIGTLAGGIAHDLNNVLTPVLLSIELLAAKVVGEEDRELIDKARISASHGAALVQQLLAYARGSDACRTKIDLRTALADLEGLVRQSLPRTIKLSVQIPEEPWAIEADATQFKQVLVNLCLNARDALPTGGRIEIVARNVTLDAAASRAHPGVQPGRFLQLSVVDTGVGIAPGILDNIFDPFFTTKASGKGTGLGLSMVAGIMKSHGGFVQVESEAGKGATFTLSFPALAAPPPVPVRNDLQTLRGNGELILVVDDEPLVRDMLRLMLQHAGYRVVTAPDGESGVAEFRRQRSEIALAISDMMLPGISGMDVVYQIRRDDPKLPVIAISGMMGSGAFDALLDLRPRVECLAKPIPPAVLLGAVRRGLGAGAAAGPAS